MAPQMKHPRTELLVPGLKSASSTPLASSLETRLSPSPQNITQTRSRLPPPALDIPPQLQVSAPISILSRQPPLKVHPQLSATTRVNPKCQTLCAGTSPVGHWLGPRLPTRGLRVQLPAQGAGIPPTCLRAKIPKHKYRRNIVNKFNKDFKYAMLCYAKSL